MRPRFATRQGPLSEPNPPRAPPPLAARSTRRPALTSRHATRARTVTTIGRQTRGWHPGALPRLTAARTARQSSSPTGARSPGRRCQRTRKRPHGTAREPPDRSRRPTGEAVQDRRRGGHATHRAQHADEPQSREGRARRRAAGTPLHDVSTR
jgi:hypothetical protein